jgi:hypothetical protein
MFPPIVAEQLQRRGHDVIAARAFPHLKDLSDRDMIAFALRESRVIVTENHRDFINLDSELRREGFSHTDFILTSDRRFPRRHHAGVGRLVTALDAWLNEHPEEATASSIPRSRHQPSISRTEPAGQPTPSMGRLGPDVLDAGQHLASQPRST